jgi:thiol-disulfide isomerase/thioredoxin
MTTSTRTARVRAPEFGRGRWLNTDRARTLVELRGRVVLLDFWTAGCANCLHVLEELRALESEFGDDLVIVGVHSPKFEHEKADHAVASAIGRYRVTHPVYNDPEMYLWGQYAVRAWPTLVLIDQAGYIVAQAAGEGHADSLAIVIRRLLADTSGAGTKLSAHPYRAIDRPTGELAFPAKAIVVGDSLLISDAGHHQLVQTDLSGQQVRRRIGDGNRGASGQQLGEPNGLALLPAELAQHLGYDLVVADTVNHALRGVRLVDGQIVSTVDLFTGLAGARTITGPVPAVLSPWDVVWWPAIERVVIAAAGVHLLLTWDPALGSVDVLAGTTVEGCKDGPALDTWLAQPSGLAVDGDRLWFVDAETSALRYLTARGQVRTVVGEGLFDFGLVDGPASTARLQHPLGLAVLPDGTIAIADTYNGAVRRYRPDTDDVETIARDLDEPSGLVMTPAGLLAVESGAHRLTPIDWEHDAGLEAGVALRTPRPVTAIAPGSLDLAVRFTPPPGRHLDDRSGPAVQVTVSATPPELLAAGAGVHQALEIPLVLDGSPGETGVLHVSATAASCDDGPHAACHLARQDWGIPIRLAMEAPAVLELMLLG